MKRYPVLSYFVLAMLFSWATWAPLTARALGLTAQYASPYLHLVGGLGPLCAAIVMTVLCDGRAGVARLWESCTTLRGRGRWIVLAITAPILLFVLSATALSVFAGAHIVGADVGRSVEYPQLTRGAYWIANIVFYGFGEEVGWRGFALPRMQAKYTAWKSALLIGAAWALWHLPLFAFSAGMSSMGLGGAVGWFFSILTGSVLMTWLFNASGGSVLAVALFHGVLDIVMTSPVGGAMPMTMGAMSTIWGVAIPIMLGTKNLSRAPRVRHSSVDA